MVTYEYECESCGHRFERRQSIREAALTECPECRGPVHRIVSGGAGFMLKGSAPEHGKRTSGGCSLERSGRTCCGRDDRCGKPSCGDGS